jgi:hypothetical protein
MTNFYKFIIHINTIKHDLSQVSFHVTNHEQLYLVPFLNLVGQDTLAFSAFVSAFAFDCVAKIFFIFKYILKEFLGGVFLFRIMGLYAYKWTFAYL